MNQIERYIFRRIVILSVGTLLASTVIAMTTQVLLYINVLTSTGQSIRTFLTLAVMLMPKVATIVMPFALLIGAGQTLSNMNEDSELVVMEAAGAAPSYVAKPLLLVAAAMSLFTLFSNHVIEPWSNRQVRDIITNARGDLFSAAVSSGSFTQLDTGVYLNIGNVGRGGELQGIFIADGRDKETDFTYYARSGRTLKTKDTELLVMSDGQIQRKNKGNGEVSIIKFQTYMLDLALFPGGTNGSRYFPKERPTPYLFHPDADDPYVTERPDLYVQEIHKRFTDWLYPLLFGFVAMAFLGTAHSNRSERMEYAVLAFLVTLGFRGFGFYAVPESGTSPLFAYLAYAVPLAGIAFYGTLVALGRQIRLPKWWSALVNDSLTFPTRLWNALTARFAPREAKP